MNWGTKLILGMIAFMLFILTLVFMMISRHGEDGLVEKNYYEMGQDFDREMQLKQHTLTDGVTPELIISEQGMTIQFAGESSYKAKLRRPSDEKLDRDYQSGMPVKELVIPSDQLASGPWNLKIEFEQNGKSYLFEEKFTMP